MLSLALRPRLDSHIKSPRHIQSFLLALVIDSLLVLVTGSGATVLQRNSGREKAVEKKQWGGGNDDVATMLEAINMIKGLQTSSIVREIDNACGSHLCHQNTTDMLVYLSENDRV